MKCKFCETKWETKGKKGTRSHFSILATLYWLLLASIFFVAIAFHRSIFGAIVGGGAQSIDPQTSSKTEQETSSESNLPSLEETTSHPDAEEEATNE
ncbi:MAG: hypothetical protein ACI4NP_04875 [Thermoguttaceae bacterium]